MRRNNENTPNKSRRALKIRLIMVSVLFVLFASGLVGRLFFLQIITNDDLVSRSKQQHQMIVKVNHARGFIYDRNMNELAANIKVESVYATPQEVKNKKKAARFLAKTLKLNEKLIFKKMNSKRNFIWIKRKVSPSEISRLRNDLPIGINFISEDKRFFPKRELASGVIGFTGIDNQGLAGIEHQYDKTLKGNITKTVIKKDARGKFVQFNEKVSGQYAENGGMVLAIDEVIQFFAEHHLGKQIKKYHAKSGVAIVMNPNTGEIYAIANMPQYNPNNYSSYKPKGGLMRPCLMHMNQGQFLNRF